MTTTRGTTYTDFLALPDDGRRHELVRGEILTMPPPKGRHGYVEARLVAAIDRYLEGRAMELGWREGQGADARDRLVGAVASGEAGIRFSLPDDPDQVRGVDVLYLSPEQVNRLGTLLDDEYVPEVPALVAEVISPSQSPDDVDQKVADYLAGGARMVWTLHPRAGTVGVFMPDDAPRTTPAGGTLEGGDVLPGFYVSLLRLFGC